MVLNWRESVDKACERLMEFIGTCKLDVQGVQGVQSMQFALADFEAELSMALASGVDTKDDVAGGKGFQALPPALYKLTSHADAFLRTAGWRAMTYIARSKILVDVFDLTSEGESEEEAAVKGKRFVLHLVRALDGGGGSTEEQLEALQLVLSLCQQESLKKPAGPWRDEVRAWQLVLPSVVNACSVAEEEEDSEAPPCNPRVLLKALEVLRNIAMNFPNQISSLKHLKPLLLTLCTLSFLDVEGTYALNMEAVQRETIAMASQQALSSMLAHVTARKNLGWDTAAVFGPILSPFTDLAISEVPKDEEDILGWDQIHTLKLLPNCMQGLFRMAQSWSGVFLLTTHTKAEKSVLEVLVQAFADTKVSIVRCVFILLFSGLLGLPMEESAAEYWIEKTGIKLDFDGVFFWEDSGHNSGGSGSSPPSSDSMPCESDEATPRKKNFVELAKRVHRGVLVNALFDAGLHFHLKNAMKQTFEPKRSIPLLLDAFLEMSHFCLRREKLILMQGCHNIKEKEGILGAGEAGIIIGDKQELPEMSYLVSQSEIKDHSLRKLQSIVLRSNASNNGNAASTASQERKTIMQTLRSSTVKGNSAAASNGISVEDFNRGEAQEGSLELEEKLAKLQELLADSGVLKYSSKYWKYWKWEYFALILDLCKGIPEEGIKLCMRSKLLKRLFAFYAKRLPDVPIDNYKGRVSVQCGMELMKLLIETEEGRNFLSGKSSFLDQLPEVNLFETIVKGLELEIGPKDVKKGRIFHPALVKHTHAFGLIRMVLQIADTRRGIHMLYRFGISQSLEQVVQDGGNLELCRQIFARLSLQINDFPQKLVGNTLSSSIKADSRLFRFAILCVQRNVVSLPHPKSVNDESSRKSVAWFAKLFVNSLDAGTEEKKAHFALLAAQFCSLGYTKYLITAGVTKLGDKVLGYPVLLEHLLLHDDGFKFLNESGWLENHITDQLLEEKTTCFMDTVHNLQSSRLQSWLRSSIFDKGSSDDDALVEETQRAMTELSIENVFHSLGCTKLGLDWMIKHQILEMLIERIDDDDEPFVNRQAFLWYLALFASGSEDAGRQVVEVGGIDAIAFVAMVSTNFMLRGQAFVAMNIASNSEAVEDHLREKHSSWQVFPVDRRVKNGFAKLCMPRDLGLYLNSPRRKTMMHIKRWCDSHRERTLAKRSQRKVAVDDVVLSALGQLSNPIAEEHGKRALAKLKHEEPEKVAMSNSCLYWQLLLNLDIPKSARQFLWACIE
ncbi:hypothetical protein A3770_10p58490 [Chloropicon primus]|uniref:Rapamycin-insensitive companion of mTOR middle domain-containing protein n=1 Tax=Chloropicon primus TaxID=1764295 RepID=A0A5B8MSL5_9CHLO|nr:hypothetical protein A3770_10p58490 [Chloropicon primus]|eukprot:QDZ23331.1 hypothetical protein A3770_10p58490 [Chloropicon primus]